MRNAVLVRLLVAAADAGPDPERRGFQMRHGIGNHGEAGGEFGNIDAHPATPCFAARLAPRTNLSTSTWTIFMILMWSGFVITPSNHVGTCGRTPQAASTAS